MAHCAPGTQWGRAGVPMGVFAWARGLGKAAVVASGGGDGGGSWWPWLLVVVVAPGENGQSKDP